MTETEKTLHSLVLMHIRMHLYMYTCVHAHTHACTYVHSFERVRKYSRAKQALSIAKCWVLVCVGTGKCWRLVNDGLAHGVGW